MKKTLLLLALALMGSQLNAQTINGKVRKSAAEEIRANAFLCGSNHLDYDNYPATEKLTPAPKGYEPYLMNHYGRHGSRWLLGDGEYSRSIRVLAKAKEQGKLTAVGEQTLDKLQRFYPCTIKRLGDFVGEVNSARTGLAFATIQMRTITKASEESIQITVKVS